MARPDASRGTPADEEVLIPVTAVYDTIGRGYADDLATGRWDVRLGHLRAQPDADLGYRLVVSERPSRRAATR